MQTSSCAFHFDNNFVVFQSQMYALPSPSPLKRKLKFEKDTAISTSHHLFTACLLQ